MRLAISAALILIVVTAGFGQSVSERAEAAYAAGDYPRAAALWVQAAEERGHPSDLINAGQALIMVKDLGRAMLYFKRAQLTMPRAPEVQLGIALVRSLRVDVYREDQRALPALERMTVELVSSAELEWLAVLALLFAGAAWMFHVLRRPVRAVASALTISAVVLVVLLAARVESMRTAPPAIVTSLEAILYSRSDSTGFELSRVYAGAEARIEGTAANRTLLSLPDGRSGWIDNIAVEPVVIGSSGAG